MKNIFKINSKPLPIIIMMALPTLSMANEILGQNLSEIQGELSYQINNLIEKGQNNKHTLIPKGKPELEALFGNWMLTYTLDRVYTNRLEINNHGGISEDGLLIATGKFFLNNNSASQYLECTELSGGPSGIEEFLDSKYLCATETINGFEAYAFRYSGNNVTNGYYGLGATAREAGQVLGRKDTKITGYRTNDDNKPGILPSDAHYNDSTDEIIIPSLIYKDSKYRVILKNEGDFLFSVKEAQPL